MPRAPGARRLGRLPAFVSGLLCLAPAIACDVTSSEPGVPITSITGAPSNMDGDFGGPGDATSSCHASSVETYVPGAYQPAAAPSAACLGDGGASYFAFYLDCLSPNRSTSKCNAFKQTPAGAACAACILTPYSAGMLGPIIDYGEFVGGNVPGCLQITSGNVPCAGAIQQLTDCEVAACQANCPVTDSTSLAAREQCSTDADMTGCEPYYDSASKCGADGGAATSCMYTTFEEFYVAVVPLFCAQPAVAADASASEETEGGAVVSNGSDAAAGDAGVPVGDAAVPPLADRDGATSSPEPSADAGRD